MAIDYDSSLPIRSEADGDDERVQVKIVDKDNPDTQQTTVDTDSNLHVEIHGNDEAGVDRVVELSESGNVALDGDYDAATNTNPSSVGIMAHDRNGASTDRTHQNLRPTAVVGENNTVCIDVALHDEAGQNYDENNPLPVTLSESEGDEQHIYEETEDLTRKTGSTITTTDHDYTVADGRTLLVYGVLTSGSGKIKSEVKLGDGAASESFAVKATKFNSTSNTSADFDFCRVPLKVVGTSDGTTIRVTIGNRDRQDQDVHTTIIGVEKDTII